MCGIVGLLDKRETQDSPNGRILLSMLEALACRGPDGAGAAMLRSEPFEEAWTVRIAPADVAAVERLSELGLGKVERLQPQGDTLRFRIFPAPELTADGLEQALGAGPGVLEVLSLGLRLDLVKHDGSPAGLEHVYQVSGWHGPAAIGHTRMSTESRIDLSHSQPFWAHGVPDLATVHNGHITNYHQLRRHYEQRGTVFYTDNDSEVIGVYLRDRLDAGVPLAEALAESITDLDGAFNYLVLSPEALGVVRDRFGFKPLVAAETDGFVAVATEEIALRKALPGNYRVSEPPPGRVLFYPLPAQAWYEMV